MTRLLLALVFTLAMAGPETHACTIHTNIPGTAGAHHQDQGHHQKASQCTCPQACCPPAVNAVLAPAAAWIAPHSIVHVAEANAWTSPLLSARKHILPLALAPPPPVA
jgi:hypothetical protein